MHKPNDIHSYEFLPIYIFSTCKEEEKTRRDRARGTMSERAQTSNRPGWCVCFAVLGFYLCTEVWICGSLVAGSCRTGVLGGLVACRWSAPQSAAHKNGLRPDEQTAPTSLHLSSGLSLGIYTPPSAPLKPDSSSKDMCRSPGTEFSCTFISSAQREEHKGITQDS